jgi:hypothetical protein
LRLRRLPDVLRSPSGSLDFARRRKPSELLRLPTGRSFEGAGDVIFSGRKAETIRVILLGNRAGAGMCLQVMEMWMARKDGLRMEGPCSRQQEMKLGGVGVGLLQLLTAETTLPLGRLPGPVCDDRSPRVKARDGDEVWIKCRSRVAVALLHASNGPGDAKLLM